jgi:NitT/TauT family transport system substrate-binding protein
MSKRQAEGWSRRQFLAGLTLAGTTGLLGLHLRPVAAEPPPETTTLTIVRTASTCQAPQYVAGELLKSEGFTEVHYVRSTEAGGVGIAKLLASGEADLTMNFVGPLLVRIGAGDPIVLMAGGHVGCYELVGSPQMRTIRDLKGKTVALLDRGTSYIFFASIVAYVGLNPRTDLHVVTHPADEAKRLLTEGKIDAFLAFPPSSQELQAERIGHALVNSAVDRPWSQYFCCMVAGNREFVRKHPVAAKRALRAILKAADLCALEPNRAAQSLVDQGFTDRYDYALQLMKDLPYGKWREYNPEDTVRFFALRLHEIGMIKSTPQKLIAQGTDWRFLNELKRELKG